MTIQKPTLRTLTQDSNKLINFASAQAYKEGLLYYKQDRVIEHYVQQGKLYATVEGSNPMWPYHLNVHLQNDGEIIARCECNAQEKLCKHAIAALLSLNDNQDEAESLGSAKDTAIADRIKRAQTEVEVKHLDGLPRFGRWQAKSLISTTGREQSYTVYLRSVTDKVNYCNCPDLANNQLGTCKHIEAVIYQLEQNPQEPTNTPPFIYKNFGEHGGIWLTRTPQLSERADKILNQYFDSSGRFIKSLPDDFFKLNDALYDDESIHIGEDARKYAMALLEQRSNRAEAESIGHQIMLSNGHLSGIDAKLYPYQLEGAAFLAGNGRALLADDMGLGKTLQSIAAANYLVQQAHVTKVLIIAPASLKHQWAREIERFTGQTAQIIEGNAQERSPQYQATACYFILNYELAMRDLSVINEQLKPDLLILDEAQRIKNWRTKVASSVKAIHSQYAFVLTGTPLENKLEELYSLMQVVDQDLLGPLWRYMSDYHILDDKGKVLAYRNLTELRQKVQHRMLRRNRSIVAQQLPERTTVQLDIPMSTKQIELHDNAMNHAGNLAEIAKRRPLTPSERNNLMSALQQARMACDGAGLVDKTTLGAPKLTELKSLIEQVCNDGGMKLVVFSAWKLMTDMVEHQLQEMNIGFVHLHGGIPTKNRGALTDSFNNDDNCRIFLSTDAGGSGLNLQAASVLVNLDVPWNPAILQQRNARVHRLGQSRQVQIFMMVSQDSYEQKVLQLVNNKQALFNNVIDPEGTEDIVGISKKTLDEILTTIPKPQAVIDQEKQQKQKPQSQQVAAKKPEEKTTAIKLPASLKSSDNDQLVAQLLKLQQHFDDRLEQIVAKGGGLLILLSELLPIDNDFVDALKLEVPVALVQSQTLHQLKSLGISSLLEDSEPVELSHSAKIEAPNPWQRQAIELLNATAKLLEQNIQNGVLELLASTIAHAMTAKSNTDVLISIDDLPVWLYAEAVPNQILAIEQASVISRVIGLRQVNTVPEALIAQSYEDTKQLLAELFD